MGLRCLGARLLGGAALAPGLFQSKRVQENLRPTLNQLCYNGGGKVWDLGDSLLDNIVLLSKQVAAEIGRTWDMRLERVLRFCENHPEFLPGYSPTRPLSDKYMRQYVTRYYNARERQVKVSNMATKPDPVVNEVLRAFYQKRPGELAAIESAHRMSMAAENLVGELLERYLATLLEEKGWVWACGNTMRAVDFLKDAAGNTQLLQVKNRDNSENSSSSAIRSGTKIQKWYRVKSKTGQTCWDRLPDNQISVLTEQGFYDFVHDCAACSSAT